MTDVSFILWLQSFRTPWLDEFLRAITRLGNEEFYIIAIPIIYWCVDRVLGYRLAVVVLFSQWANAALKWSFNTPRPPAPPVVRLVTQTDPSFPSGHAQGTTAFWGYLAESTGSRALAIAAVIIVAAVSLSRLYLGVHFPIDILGGAAIGVILVFAFVSLFRYFAEVHIPWIVTLAGATLFPFALLLLYHRDDAAVLVGVLSGVGFGHVLGMRYIRYESRSRLGTQVIKVIIGVAALLALRYGLKPLLPPGFTGALFRYWVIGFAATAVIPWLFSILPTMSTGIPRGRAA